MLKAIKNAGEQVLGDEKLPKYEKIKDMEEIRIERGTSVIVGGNVKKTGYWSDGKPNRRFVDLDLAEVDDLPEVMFAFKYPEDGDGVEVYNMSQTPIEMQCFVKSSEFPEGNPAYKLHGGPYMNAYIGKFDRSNSKVGTLQGIKTELHWSDIGETREFTMALAKGKYLRLQWIGGSRNNQLSYRAQVTSRRIDLNTDGGSS